MRKMIDIYIFYIDETMHLGRQETAKLAEQKFIGYLQKKHQFSQTTVRICKNYRGKPYLKDHPQFHISRSYCPLCVVYGFGESPMGVDVEVIREYNKFLADQFYCTSELNDTSPEEWTRLWTAKEAFAKYLGTGLSVLRYNRTPVKELIEKNNLTLTDIKANRYMVCSLIAGKDHVDITEDTLI